MERKYVALTFDDGPNNVVTPLILDICKKYKIVASFFECGININDSIADIMKRQIEQGCEICNHSFSHPDMTTISNEDIIKEIEKTNSLIKKYTGTTPKFFRPPFIRVNQKMFDLIDLPFICGECSSDWSVDEKADETVRIILSKVKAGDIILLHDSDYNSKSADAIDKIIPALLMQDYEFVTISKLFDIYGVTTKKNIVYSNANDK